MLYVQEAQGSVDEVAQRLVAAVAKEKFGVLGEHNLKQKMEQKGVDFDAECRVFEVCNPQQAQKVLSANMAVANALPCRICVYEQGGKVFVSTLKPTALLGLFQSPQLQPVAEEVEAAITRMIDAACESGQ